jgi:hypothetical protein
MRNAFLEQEVNNRNLFDLSPVKELFCTTKKEALTRHRGNLGCFRDE